LQHRARRQAINRQQRQLLYRIPQAIGSDCRYGYNINQNFTVIILADHIQQRTLTLGLNKVKVKQLYQPSQ